MDAGATIALGADDPLLFGSRLEGQYATMRAAHDLSDDQLAELARMSIRASCAPDDVQKSALADIDTWLAPDSLSGGFPPLSGGLRRQPSEAPTRRSKPHSTVTCPYSTESEGAADEDGLVDEADAEAGLDAVADLAGQREQVGRGRAAAVGEREGVLGGEAEPVAAVPLRGTRPARSARPRWS